MTFSFCWNSPTPLGRALHYSLAPAISMVIVLEQSVIDQSLYDQPVSDHPVSDELALDQSLFEQPVYEWSVFDQSLCGKPVFDRSVFDHWVTVWPASIWVVSFWPVTVWPASIWPVSFWPLSHCLTSQSLTSQCSINQCLTSQCLTSQCFISQYLIRKGLSTMIISTSGPDSLSDLDLRSDQLLWETSGMDPWNRSLDDFIGLLHWLPVAADQIARLSRKVDQGFKSYTSLPMVNVNIICLVPMINIKIATWYQW